MKIDELTRMTDRELRGRIFRAPQGDLLNAVQIREQLAREYKRRRQMSLRTK